MLIVRAVIVQMTTVSMNGSKMATKPSETGRRVLTVECAIGAEPRPASLEKAARVIPTTMTPRKPPMTPSGVKAPVKIPAIAPGICGALVRMTKTQART